MRHWRLATFRSPCALVYGAEAGTGAGILLPLASILSAVVWPAVILEPLASPVPLLPIPLLLSVPILLPPSSPGPAVPSPSSACARLASWLRIGPGWWFW